MNLPAHALARGYIVVSPISGASRVITSHIVTAGKISLIHWRSVEWKTHEPDLKTSFGPDQMVEVVAVACRKKESR